MSAGRNNVITGVRAAILPGLQVLGRAPKARGISFADLVFSGKRGWLLQPHWQSTVKATAVLTIECGETVFGYRSGHDRLLEN
jgi:hypothetical protein